MGRRAEEESMLNRITCCTMGLALTIGSAAGATDLPAGFEEIEAISGLEHAATIAFAPDGRLFIGERVPGRLRVATYDDGTDAWTLLAAPFYTFDIPVDGGGQPEAHRSSGLRGFAFDPDFSTTGYVYCFYMRHDPRHNRVVRIEADPADPNVALAGETVLLDIPFNGSESSGSHNGGAIVVGHDGRLYVSSGDGWNGGDDVQSLTTYTGKVFRIARDGTIPTDNPFYDDAAGDLRAIYALGLRNPFTMAVHPDSGQIYINDVAGGNKATVYELAAGANYGHDGFDGIGTSAGEWANAGDGGSSGRIVAGGVWYPDCGVFPESYHGTYVTALWGTNGGSTGEIATIAAPTDATRTEFATSIGHAGSDDTLKPMAVTLSPEGELFYLASSYVAPDGKVFRIRPLEPFVCAGTDPVPAAGTVGVAALAALLVLASATIIRRRTPNAEHSS